jgi:pyruvate dehydrogenase E2 component (dihydrolipoamide acetyltransferase)
MTADTDIKVPDIGGASGVDVIEILVKEGDVIAKDTSIVTLESDKASMEIPSPLAGIVKHIRLKLGDKVSEGDVIITIASDSADAIPHHETKPDEERPEQTINQAVAPPTEIVDVVTPITSNVVESPTSVHTDIISAGPAARRLAHVLGVNLQDIQGSARKARITKSDIEQFVKQKLQEKSTSGGLSMPVMPVIDFSKFGEIEVKPLNKIKRLTGINVHRSWITIPHVTHFDEADITDLEAFRVSESARIKTDDFKLTMLAFVCKVLSKALAAFPQFNASLDPKGEHLIFKRYCHIGIAVETPNGLVVPVIKNVDQLSVTDIAKEMARLSTKARDKGLMPSDMSGGSMTISSLGGIGGTAFTPIVNSPEVAILGLSRAIMKPVYNGHDFTPRLMLPLSLSYDHRVIDGAEAARFTRFLSDALADIRRILL